MTVLILGTGSWGTALAVTLARKGERIRLWGRSAEFREELRLRRENTRYLPGVPFPPNLEIAEDFEADLRVIAIPTQHIRGTLGELPLTDGTFVSVAKGLELGTHLRPTEILRDLYPAAKTAVLSGPSHAEEVARGLPATVVAASEERELARSVQRLFMGETLRVYTSEPFPPGLFPEIQRHAGRFDKLAYIFEAGAELVWGYLVKLLLGLTSRSGAIRTPPVRLGSGVRQPLLVSV